MVRLSEILNKIDGCGYSHLGFVIYEMLCRYFFETGKNVNPEDSYLEGLSPDRILLDDDWEDCLRYIKIDEVTTSSNSSPYFPPEYETGGKWDSSCTVYALCAIIYRIYNCALPYVDDPDEDIDLLLSKERVENLLGERKYPLHLACFPEDLQAKD